MKLNRYFPLIITSSLLIIFFISSQFLPFYHYNQVKSETWFKEERVKMYELAIKKTLSVDEEIDRKLIAKVLASNKKEFVAQNDFIEGVMESFVRFYRILFCLLLAHFYAIYLWMRKSKPNKAIKQD
jgi:hypothetical protein